MSKLTRSIHGVTLLELPWGFQIVYDCPAGNLVWDSLSIPALNGAHTEEELTVARHRYERMCTYLHRAIEWHHPSLSVAQWGALYDVVRNQSMRKYHSTPLRILQQYGFVKAKPDWRTIQVGSRFIPIYNEKDQVI